MSTVNAASPSTAPITPLYFEDYKVGARFTTYSRTITESDLAMFCALVGYHMPLFIDEEYAKGTRFGGRIVPGSLTASYSTASTEVLTRWSIIAHMGNREAKFLGAVKPGDTITTHVEVLDSVERGESKGIVTFRDTVVNQHGAVVYTVEKLVMVKRRTT
jgi:acyl dehydratase